MCTALARNANKQVEIHNAPLDTQLDEKAQKVKETWPSHPDLVYNVEAFQQTLQMNQEIMDAATSLIQTSLADTYRKIEQVFANKNAFIDGDESIQTKEMHREILHLKTSLGSKLAAYTTSPGRGLDLASLVGPWQFPPPAWDEIMLQPNNQTASNLTIIETRDMIHSVYWDLVLQLCQPPIQYVYPLKQSIQLMHAEIFDILKTIHNQHNNSTVVEFITTTSQTDLQKMNSGNTIDQPYAQLVLSFAQTCVAIHKELFGGEMGSGCTEMRTHLENIILQKETYTAMYNTPFVLVNVLKNVQFIARFFKTRIKQSTHPCFTTPFSSSQRYQNMSWVYGMLDQQAPEEYQRVNLHDTAALRKLTETAMELLLLTHVLTQERHTQYMTGNIPALFEPYRGTLYQMRYAIVHVALTGTMGMDLLSNSSYTDKTVKDVLEFMQKQQMSMMCKKTTRINQAWQMISAIPESKQMVFRGEEWFQVDAVHSEYQCIGKILHAYLQTGKHDYPNATSAIMKLTTNNISHQFILTNTMDILEPAMVQLQAIAKEITQKHETDLTQTIVSWVVRNA